MYKKAKKWMPILMFGGTVASFFLPLAFSALAFFNFKSLLVGKIALVLAGISLLKHYKKESEQRFHDRIDYIASPVHYPPETSYHYDSNDRVGHSYYDNDQYKSQ